MEPGGVRALLVRERSRGRPREPEERRLTLPLGSAAAGDGGHQHGGLGDVEWM